MEKDMRIAVRRTPRRTAGRQGLNASACSPPRRPARHVGHSMTSETSHTSKPKKRKRPFEPDSITISEIEAGPLTPPSSGPKRAIPTTKRRKYAAKTPSEAQTAHFSTFNTTPGSNEVRIFPLRAILDDRVKRRIRRNGLSEEMNVIYGERRQRAKKSIEEMAQLRDQLAAKEIENEMLREQSSLLQDTSRIQELEKEISDLRQLEGMRHSDLQSNDWDMAAGDGFSDSGSLMGADDGHFLRDDTTVEVEDTSSPILAKHFIDTVSTLTPPNTSPTKPGTPESTQNLFQVPHSDVGVQVDLESQGKAHLETELASLRSELVGIHKTLEAHQQLELQLKDQLSLAEKAQNVAVDIDPDHQLQMDILVQTLAEKTATLAAINANLASLGQPGVEANDVISSLREAFQGAQTELQELNLGGQPLDMTIQGTEILQQMLQCLRYSAAQVKQLETVLEDYGMREDQLRNQLNARVEAMGTLSRNLRLKDDHIFKLEADLERSQAVSEECRESLTAARRTIVHKDTELCGMEENLKSMISVGADLQSQLAQIQVDRETDMFAKEAYYGKKIAKCELTVLELRKDITSLNKALKQAHESISDLQADKTRLQGDADREKKAARDTVTSLRTQLLQSLQMSEAFLA